MSVYIHYLNRNTLYIGNLLGIQMLQKTNTDLHTCPGGMRSTLHVDFWCCLYLAVDAVYRTIQYVNFGI